MYCVGHILQPGDTVLGYDVQHSVHTAEGEDTVNNLNFDLPDVILVRKSYPENVKTRKRKNNKPSWMKNGPTASNPTIVAAAKDAGEVIGNLEDVGDFEVVDPSVTSTPPATNATSGAGRKQKKASPGFNLDLLDIDDADKRAIIAQMEDEWEMEREEQLYLQTLKTSNTGGSGKSSKKSGALSSSEWEYLEAALTPPNLSGEMYEDLGDMPDEEFDEDDDEDEDEDDNGGEEGEEEDESDHIEEAEEEDEEYETDDSSEQK